MGSPATRLGEVLNDAYELQALISAAGPLEVYRARDRRTRTEVRIKLLRPEFALQGNVVEDFLRGPRSLAEVTHASLPTVLLDTDDTGIPFVVEETLEGRPLSSLIESFPQGLPPAMLAALALPLVEALALAHQHGLAHGSIDAEHVMLLGPPHAPTPKWLGLGALDARDSTQDANYRAPEANDATRSDSVSRADVFAIGVLLYKMLSGELPFRSGKKSAVPLDEIAPHASRAWVELTSACLTQLPGSRLTDAGAVLTRLRSCLGQRPVPAPRAQPAPTIRAKGVAEPAAISGRPVPADNGLVTRVASARAPRASARAASAAPAAARASVQPASKPPKDKKQAAKEAAEKLGARHRPLAPAPANDIAQNDRAPAARPAADDHVPASAVASATPPPGSTLAPNPIHKDRNAARVGAPPAAASRARVAGQAGPAAVALSAAQLAALRALRDDDDVDQRWLGLLFRLLLILLLLFGAPLLYDPSLASAQMQFGPRLRIVADGFCIATVIGAMHVWAAQLHSKTLIHRVTNFVMQVVTASVIVITLTLHSRSPMLSGAAEAARHGLPWGMGFLFGLFAFDYAWRGIQQLSSNVLTAVFALGLAGLSLFGTYHASLATLLKQHAKAAALIAKQRATGVAVDDIQQQILNHTGLSHPQESQKDSDSQRSRNEVGANEAEDLKPTEDLEKARHQQQQSFDNFRKGLSEPAAQEPAQP